MQSGCKRLQNAGRKIVRLTSGGQSPYFPKLDSSFYQPGTHGEIVAETVFIWYRKCKGSGMVGFVCASIEFVAERDVARHRDPARVRFRSVQNYVRGEGVLVACGSGRLLEF